MLPYNMTYMYNHNNVNGCNYSLIDTSESVRQNCVIRTHLTERCLNVPIIMECNANGVCKYGI